MLADERSSKYVQEIERLREKLKRDVSLNDEEIDSVFRQCFAELKIERKNRYKLLKRVASSLKLLLLFVLVILFFYVVLNIHQTTTSIVLRNVQGLIYPGLSLVRFLTVPIIKKYSSLTKLYDETCLLENPYFYVTDMECWPCQNVYSVIDLTNFNNYSMYPTGVPYIVRTNQSLVTYEKLIETYLEHKDMFDSDANVIKSTNSSLTEIDNLLTYKPQFSKSSVTRISWRINRMLPARVIRKLFPRPYIVSEWSGQSVERFIMISEPKSSPYQLPNFECSYVFVIQGSGEQTIVLKPTNECVSECKTVSITLKPSYVLWYNWWYWRPISLPTKNATEVSLSYVNSYC